MSEKASSSNSNREKEEKGEEDAKKSCPEALRFKTLPKRCSSKECRPSGNDKQHERLAAPASTVSASSGLSIYKLNRPAVSSLAGEGKVAKGLHSSRRSEAAIVTLPNVVEEFCSNFRQRSISRYKMATQENVRQIAALLEERAELISELEREGRKATTLAKEFILNIEKTVSKEKKLLSDQKKQLLIDYYKFI